MRLLDAVGGEHLSCDKDGAMMRSITIAELQRHTSGRAGSRRARTTASAAAGTSSAKICRNGAAQRMAVPVKYHRAHRNDVEERRHDRREQRGREPQREDLEAGNNRTRPRTYASPSIPMLTDRIGPRPLTELVKAEPGQHADEHRSEQRAVRLESNNRSHSDHPAGRHGYTAKEVIS